MKTRKKILFKLNHEIIHEDPRDLNIQQIEGMKWAIAREAGEPYDSIDVELEETYESRELEPLSATALD